MGSDKSGTDDIPGEPMVNGHETGCLDLELSDEEYNVLSHSFTPSDMNQKWMYFYEDGWIHIKRSWSGHCVLEAKVEADDDEKTIADYKIDEEFVRQELHYGDDELDLIAEKLIARMARITTRTEYVIEDGVLTPTSVDREFDQNE